ncbi:MAG: hypothetical protein P9X24_14000 [Candidatus Hatepunaea meridiana]|nr:hypothetical protein [Candidatus Hatepunaea meridiana]
MQIRNILIYKNIIKYSRIIIGLVFLLAAVTKGMDIIRFGRRIEMVFGTYGAAEIEAWILIALIIGCILLLTEFIIGSMLVFGYKSRLAAKASIGLLVIFIVKFLWEIHSGQDLDCGCFGTLIERSAGSALFENIIYLIIAIFSIKAVEQNSPKRKHLTMLIIGAGLCWVLLFQLFPLGSVVARTGSVDKLPGKTIIENRYESRLIWLFDPECPECLDKLDLLNAISHNDSLPIVLGLTDATHGRIQEFLWDFNPQFEITQISEHEIQHIYLPSGSLIFIKDNRIRKIWRPKLIPSLKSLESKYEK